MQAPASERYEATLTQPLVDAELWPPVFAALRAARTRIDLSQLLFEPDFHPLGVGLADAIEAASRRGVRVRILMNENAAVADSYDELRARFSGTAVEVGSLPMTPNVLHMKLLLVDEQAFLIDAPFEQKYADTSAHAYDDPRRGPELPVHSVSLRLEGPIVERLAQLYECAWEGRALPPAPPQAASGPRLAWSAPPGTWGDGTATGIVEAYEQALGQARRFVYIENQYFTSPRILRAIQEALDREPSLEVIMVLNETMDVPTYDLWQARRLSELGHPDHPRLGVFSLWSPRRLPDDPAVRRIYVHSKVAIVDDEWLTIGSANLDSISLHEADEWGFSSPPNVELNAVFEDAALATQLRRRLWAEHLGDQGVWSASPPPGGWLAHWRGVAEGNLRRFHEGDVERSARVLPYGSIAPGLRERVVRAVRSLTAR